MPRLRVLARPLQHGLPRRPRLARRAQPRDRRRPGPRRQGRPLEDRPLVRLPQAHRVAHAGAGGPKATGAAAFTTAPPSFAPLHPAPLRRLPPHNSPPRAQVEFRRRRKLQPKGSAWSKTAGATAGNKLSFPAPPTRLPPSSPKRGMGPPPLPGMRRGGAGDSFSKGSQSFSTRGQSFSKTGGGPPMIGRRQSFSKGGAESFSRTQSQSFSRAGGNGPNPSWSKTQPMMMQRPSFSKGGGSHRPSFSRAQPAQSFSKTQQGVPDEPTSNLFENIPDSPAGVEPVLPPRARGQFPAPVRPTPALSERAAARPSHTTSGSARVLAPDSRPLPRPLPVPPLTPPTRACPLCRAARYGGAGRRA